MMISIRVCLMTTIAILLCANIGGRLEVGSQVIGWGLGVAHAQSNKQQQKNQQKNKNANSKNAKNKGGTQRSANASAPTLQPIPHFRGFETRSTGVR